MDTTEVQAALWIVEQPRGPRRLSLAEDGGTSDGEVDALRNEVLQLREALSSRAVIDQAKGMLMARFGVSADRAFDLLVQKSKERNIKVRVIAGLMVDAAARGNLVPEPAYVSAIATGNLPEGTAV